MFKHRIVFIGAWIALVIALFIVPGFEAKGLVMGLMIGGWPFLFLSEHLLDELIVILIMFVLSGATVGFCAWFMDRVNMTEKTWVLLIALMIAGAAFLSMDSLSFEGWKSLPAIEAAMESPEVNYQPTRLDYDKQIVIPRALAGGLMGLYMTAGIGCLCAIAILLRRHCLMRQKQIQTNQP